MHTWREVVASSRRGVRVPYVGWIAFDRLQKTIESDPDRLWGIFMMKQFVAPFVLSISLLGCGGQGLSPAQLTGDQQSDLAVREYLLASYQLAHQFGFDFRYVRKYSSEEQIKKHQHRSVWISAAFRCPLQHATHSERESRANANYAGK